jgi:hypothetical protein
VIDTLLAAGTPTLFVTAWMLYARSFFRRWRIHIAQKAACPKRATLYRHDDHCEDCRGNALWWQDEGTGAARQLYGDDDLAFLAVLQAFFWPLFIIPRAAASFVRYNPPKAPVEIEAENARHVAEIERLEAENRRMEKALEDGK